MSLRIRARALGAASVLAAASAASVSAQAPRDTVRLPPLVITATRFPTERGAVPNAVTVLEGEELERRGVTRVLDALREVPGLTVVQSGSPGAVTSLFVRGGESDHVRVLVDGVPANQPGGSIDLANLTTDNVERIEIVRGPVSALFGSDALAGVVQIFTRAGRRQQAPAVSATVLGGDAGGRIAGALRGGTGRVSFTVAGSSASQDGAYDLNHRYRSWSASSLLRADGARGDAQVAVRHSDGEYHYPSDFTGNPTDSNQFTAGRLTTVSAEAGRAMGRRTELRFAAGATSGVDRAVNPPDSAGDFSAYASRTEYARRGADLRANMRLAGRSMLTAGAAVEHQRFWSSSDSLTRTRNSRAMYAQLVAGVTRHATLTVGARGEDNDQFGRFGTARAGVAVRMGAGMVLRAGVGTGFKEPTFLEVHGGGFATGNPALAPERSRSAEVGVERRLAGGRALVGATLFAQRFDSIIQYTFSVPAGEPNYRNIAGAGARGLEIELRAAAWRGAALTAQWTWLHTAVRDSGVDGATFAVGRPLLRRPAQAGSLALAQAVSGRADLSAQLFLVGRRDDIDFDPATFAPRRVELPAYGRLDVAAAVTLLDAGSGGVVLHARVENALDRRYEEVLHFPARGRTVWIGASYRGSD